MDRYKSLNIKFDPNLPITGKRHEIINAIKNNQVIIISGETGSGKTTQIPKLCLKAGQGRQKIIGCTQPRRIAAINVAKRISQELGTTKSKMVGYKIRFDDKTLDHTCIKIMTDGVLLAETRKDRFLKQYDTIIVDEAHERSLNIDFVLGILKRLINKRKDLKLIISSATIDTEKFSRAFDNASVIEVLGRMFPVQVQYLPFLLENEDQTNEDQGYIEAALSAVNFVLSNYSKGDILVFMPTQQDISDTIKLIKDSNADNIVVLPLFARLSPQDQLRVFANSLKRKVIVATNVAETSLTIPNIKYVIDTGLARISSYSSQTRTTSLLVQPVSKASANQRKGRCGRVAKGLCIRLFDKDDFENRQAFTTPEILRSNLAEVILRMIFLNLGDVFYFPFIDKPSDKSIKDGFATLVELGALQKNKIGYKLTKIGRIMAMLPIDPKLSRILIEANAKGCLNEAVVITSALAIFDPRQRSFQNEKQADLKHKQFADNTSDFISFLNVWDTYQREKKQLKSRTKLKKYCQANYLSFKRLKEWDEICRQLIRILKEHEIKSENALVYNTTKNLKSKEYETGGPLYIALHQAILSGYLTNIAHKKEKNIFNAAKGQQAMIFPGSGLFNNAGSWIVAAQFVTTSRLFAKTVANIEPQWIEPVAKHLCKYSYFDPHWAKSQGRVVVKEQVSLFGLIIVPQREVAYGKINAIHAGEIFIYNALVKKEINQKFDFLIHNQKLIDKCKNLEDKLRKKDISEDDIFNFYKSKLKKPFFDIRTFARFINEQKKSVVKTSSQNNESSQKDFKNDDFLKLSMADLEKNHIDKEQLAFFPDTLEMNQKKFKLEYIFNPKDKKDGITIKVPQSHAHLVLKNEVDKLVPGLFEKKIAALIKALPKKYRIKLMPVTKNASIIVKDIHNKEMQDLPLFFMLSSIIKKRFKVVIPINQWSDAKLPYYLKMRISIRDSKDQEIKALRDSSFLADYSFSRHKNDSEELFLDSLFEAFKKKHEKEDIRKWDFKDLEEFIIFKDKKGLKQKFYPALKVKKSNKKKDELLSLRLFASKQGAHNSHVKGIKKLFLLCYQDDFAAFRKDIQSFLKTKILSVSIKQSNIKNLYHIAKQFVQVVLLIEKEYQACEKLLKQLSLKHSKNKTLLNALQSFMNDLEKLVPQNFLFLYKFEQIKHLKRFIACINIRAQRAVENFEKEKKKALQLVFYDNILKKFLSELSFESSDEKSQKIEEFFWLLEEYKVSIFAQELKTSVKISSKILDEAVERISSLI